MNTPFKKRNDPFADSIPAAEKEKEVVVEKVAEKEEKPVVKPQPKKVQVVEATDDNNREKYTATMDKSLRRRIKVAAALTGIQVSSFIEQACLEKLDREGQ